MFIGTAYSTLTSSFVPTMTDATRRALSSNKKKRGTTRASVTWINTRLRELEDVPDLPATIGHAQRLIAKLQTLAEEFKIHHFAVIDLIDDEEELAAQQTILDNLDDDVTQITVGLEALTTKGTSTTNNVAKVALKRLRYLERGFTSVSDSLESLDEEENTCLLQQHRDRLTDMRKELSDIRQEFLSVDHEDTREFDELLDRFEQTLFDLSLKIRKLLRPVATATAPTLVDTLKPVKLPKLDVPTFDGNILNWTTFWEQFDISIHSRSDLATAEKLAYLRNALKNGSAKNAIEGLSRSGEQYEEAVSRLKDRYDKPRLIHQAHVRKIVEIPSLKDGNGKELRRLHDTAQQHLRALKALGHEPDEAFITSMIELKLDGQTMFEWQRHSQDSTDVPPYQKLLDFIKLRAQASENSSDFGRRIPKGDTPIKKPSATTKHITSYISLDLS